MTYVRTETQSRHTHTAQLTAQHTGTAPADGLVCGAVTIRFLSICASVLCPVCCVVCVLCCVSCVLLCAVLCCVWYVMCAVFLCVASSTVQLLLSLYALCDDVSRDAAADGRKVAGTEELVGRMTELKATCDENKSNVEKQQDNEMVTGTNRITEDKQRETENATREGEGVARVVACDVVGCGAMCDVMC